MKRLLSILFVAVAVLGMTACAKNEKVAPEQVPNSLRMFVKSNFGEGVQIVAAERDREFGGFEYEVTLSNGCEIDYGVSEEWLEVDAKGGTVPPSIVGDEIMSNIQVSYPSATVKSIERESYGYKVKLNNGVKLKYGKDYKYIGIDD